MLERRRYLHVAAVVTTAVACIYAGQRAAVQDSVTDDDEPVCGGWGPMNITAVVVIAMPQRRAFVHDRLMPQVRCMLPWPVAHHILNATRPEDVDVRQLSLSNRYAFDFGRSHDMDIYAPASAGCYLSHMRALQIAAAEHGRTLVLEDKVDLSPLLLSAGDDIRRADAAERPDLLRLSDCSHGASTSPTPYGGVIRCAARCFSGGSAAYVVGPVAARRLLDARDRHIVHYDWFQGLVHHYARGNISMQCVQGLDLRKGAPMPSLNGGHDNCLKCDIPTDGEPRRRLVFVLCDVVMRMLGLR